MFFVVVVGDRYDVAIGTESGTSPFCPKMTHAPLGGCR